MTSQRLGLVDLGSNSVRLVVFEGGSRNPLAIFNEKAVLRLGRGLDKTGRLNEEGVAQALGVMERFAAIARAMGADPFDVLATAAVRDAANGPAFAAELAARIPGIAIRVVPGEEEAALSGEGLLCAIPEADGVMADIGGGSLELLRVQGGACGAMRTLRLGVIRLADRAGGELAQAQSLVAADLATVGWLGEGEGRDLYLVGGAFRALGRIHMARTQYPLAIVHRYALGRDEALALATAVAEGAARLERIAGLSRRRLEDLPYAALVLRRLLRASGARRVVFSASGLREGWYMRRQEAAVRQADPMMAAATDLAARYSRDPALPAALVGWTAPLFPHESPTQARLREAACLLSDIGSHDHPEYRAEQAFLRVLRQPGVGLDHPSRAFLALAVAARHDAPEEAAWLRPARSLLGAGRLPAPEPLGRALRLAYALCGGTASLLAGSRIGREGATLVLRIEGAASADADVQIARRLDRLAQALGLAPVLRVGAASVLPDVTRSKP